MTPEIPVGRNAGLGRLLFERRRVGPILALELSACFCACVGSGLLIFSESLRLYAIAGFSLAALLYIVSRYVGVEILRCHELGFVRTKGRDERIIHYREISEFTYRNGRGSGSSYGGAEVEVTARTPETTIHFVENLSTPDNDMLQLCREISELIADRMQDELQSGRRVPWLDDVTLLPEGLQIRRSTIWGTPAREANVLPYAAIAAVQLEESQGQGFVFSTENLTSPVLKRSIACTNFWPGFVLLQRLVQGRATISPWNAAESPQSVGWGAAKQLLGGAIFVMGIGLLIGNVTGTFRTFPFAGYIVMGIGGAIYSDGKRTG